MFHVCDPCRKKEENHWARSWLQLDSIPFDYCPEACLFTQIKTIFVQDYTEKNFSGREMEKVLKYFLVLY